MIQVSRYKVDCCAKAFDNAVPLECWCLGYALCSQHVLQGLSCYMPWVLSTSFPFSQNMYTFFITLSHVCAYTNCCFFICFCNMLINSWQKRIICISITYHDYGRQAAVLMRHNFNFNSPVWKQNPAFSWWDSKIEKEIQFPKLHVFKHRSMFRMVTGGMICLFLFLTPSYSCV